MNHGRCHHLPLTLISLLLGLTHFAAYELPTNYFINCGSDSSANLFGQDYAPDTPNSNALSFSPPQTTALRINPSSSIPLLYQTARVHTHPFSYKFRINTNATYFILHLHFHAFSSTPPLTNINLSDAMFDVSISGTRLLSNFNPTGSTIREFVIPLMGSPPMLQIDFTPLLQSSLHLSMRLKLLLLRTTSSSTSTILLISSPGIHKLQIMRTTPTWALK